MLRVGIPRALLYYSYYPLWNSVLTGLGAEVVLSPPTTEKILTMGARATVDEVCAPVKVAVGHALHLRDKVDLLLVPRLVSVEPKAYICPKLMGLPDMLRHGTEALPRLLDPDIDLSRGKMGVVKTLQGLGLSFGSTAWNVGRVFKDAMQEQQRVEKRILSGLLPENAFHGVSTRPGRHKTLRVAVLGHPYNVYDPLLSMNIIERLTGSGVDVVTAEMLPIQVVSQALEVLPKRLFWTLSKRVLGAGLYYLSQPDQVDGIIVLSSFGCGLESLIADLLERHARRREFPFMLLTTDEHSGEAGVVTRVEAFVDMIRGKASGRKCE